MKTNVSIQNPESKNLTQNNFNEKNIFTGIRHIKNGKLYRFQIRHGSSVVEFCGSFGINRRQFIRNLGLFLTGVTYFFSGDRNASEIYQIATTFIFMAFPLALTGAYTLYKSEEIKREINKMKRLYTAGFAMLFSLLLCGNSSAQQTIFNVPSTDVLDKGKVYGEFDASFKVNNQRDVRRFSSFVPRVVVGVGGNVEIGLDVTGNIQPGTDSTTLIPAIKYRFYQNEKKDVSVVAGTNVFVPVRNRAYNIGSYSYVNASKTFNEKTKLTAGGYFYSKNVVSTASRSGAQLGFEYTVNSKFVGAADYLTGKHANGYFTPGVFYKPTPKVTGYFGYSIGNAGALGGNNFFLFEIGYNFN